jgi:hypothetical protein
VKCSDIFLKVTQITTTKLQPISAQSTEAIYSVKFIPHLAVFTGILLLSCTSVKMEEHIQKIQPQSTETLNSVNHVPQRLWNKAFYAKNQVVKNQRVIFLYYTSIVHFAYHCGV